MTLAPVVVITVAGLSLANLYGAKGGTSAFLLPLVDIHQIEQRARAAGPPPELEGESPAPA